jgi:hypothetical protein
MTAVRGLLAGLMSKGVISPGWYAILTGLAMLLVAYFLGSAASADRAAVYVGLAIGVTGVWSVERGIRSEVRRRRID